MAKTCCLGLRFGWEKRCQLPGRGGKLGFFLSIFPFSTFYFGGEQDPQPFLPGNVVLFFHFFLDTFSHLGLLEDFEKDSSSKIKQNQSKLWQWHIVLPGPAVAPLLVSVGTTNTRLAWPCGVLHYRNNALIQLQVQPGMSTYSPLFTVDSCFLIVPLWLIHNNKKRDFATNRWKTTCEMEPKYIKSKKSLYFKRFQKDIHLPKLKCFTNLDFLK